MPEFAGFGAVFRSTKPQALTESELEYLVHVVKHVFADHVVFQFKIVNTIPEQRLDNVTVEMVTDDESWVQLASIPAATVRVGAPAEAFVAFQRTGGFDTAVFACELKFQAVDCDPDTGEADGDPFDEDFPLEDVELSTATFMANREVAGFRGEWEAMGTDGEVLESYALAFKDAATAVDAVLAFLGMAACEGTGEVKEGATRHNAYLSGVFLGGFKVLARMAVSVDGGDCVLKIAVRSEDGDVSRLVADCIR